MTRILVGDALSRLRELPNESVDCIIADPPYGQTSLKWDQWVSGWAPILARKCKPSGSMWVFGSMRMFMEHRDEFADWKQSHDVVWEKHNGSGFHADRFRRVHEHAVHFYREDAPWSNVYRCVQVTNDATRRTVRRKERPVHMGEIKGSTYRSVDGGPRLMTSVVYARSEHGRAIHPTQKPLALVAPLLEYACPPDGVVCDLFAGSGTTSVAARRTGRDCTLIEISPEYAQMAADRIRDDTPLLAQKD